MRVGILGGTFNPIHFGHLYPASKAANILKLDKIFIVPAYSPPHKPNQKIMSANHRIKMLNLAIEEYPLFKLSTVEIDRKGVSYSIETVNAFVEKGGYDDLFFIMGMDTFLDIDSWKDASHLLKSCNFIVISRQGIVFSDIFNFILKNISEKFKELSFRCGEIEPERGLKSIKVNSSPYFVVPLKIGPVNISSTEIRDKIRRGKSIKGMVPDKVNIYIEKKKLYR